MRVPRSKVLLIGLLLTLLMLLALFWARPNQRLTGRSNGPESKRSQVLKDKLGADQIDTGSPLENERSRNLGAPAWLVDGQKFRDIRELAAFIPEIVELERRISEGDAGLLAEIIGNAKKLNEGPLKEVLLLLLARSKREAAERSIAEAYRDGASLNVRTAIVFGCCLPPPKLSTKFKPEKLWIDVLAMASFYLDYASSYSDAYAPFREAGSGDRQPALPKWISELTDLQIGFEYTADLTDIGRELAFSLIRNPEAQEYGVSLVVLSDFLTNAIENDRIVADTLANELKNLSDPELRDAALKLLASNHSSEKALDALVAAFHSATEREKMELIRGIGGNQSARASGFLVDLLSRETTPAVVVACLEGLSRSSAEKDVLREVGGRFVNAEDSGVRLMSAGCLIAAGNSESRDIFYAAVQKEPTSDTRWKMLLPLYKVNATPEDIRFLKNVRSMDTDARVRERAKELLKLHGED